MSSTDFNRYIQITENNSRNFRPDQVISICKRVNNPRRDFLLVNHLQGKHIHVSPTETFRLYSELAHEIEDKIGGNEKVVVIGFAETATAIAQAIAHSLPNCVFYLQTTRELMNNSQLIVDFTEEHSHATEQVLYGNNQAQEALYDCDRIVFVDDEISTGNTILNFIKALEKIKVYPKFSVASILNLQNEEWNRKFKILDIDCFYLFKGVINDLNCKVNVEISGTTEYDRISRSPNIITANCPISNFIMDRTGFKPISISMFFEYIKEFIESTTYILPESSESVLVLGTEEFMFTPMVIANEIQHATNANVQFHATTRSPIQVSKTPNYAIETGFSISSCYSNSRKTYIYNLKKYDKVIIVSDVIPTDEFIVDITSALAHVGCDPEAITFLILER